MARRTGRFRRFSLGGRDGIVLVLSLLLSSLVWLLTNLSNSYAGLVSVPVIAECSIDGHSAQSSNRALVTARCRTSGFSLLRSQSRKERQPVRVRIDRGDLHYAGHDEYLLTGSAKNSYVGRIFGEETVVEAFVTDTLSFIFPSENHKRVPVEPLIQLNYRSQYMNAAPLKLRPDSVTVYGEAARLEQVDHVSTQRLNLWDIHESQHGTLRLSKVKGLRLSTEDVNYELEVSRYVELSTQVGVEVWNAPAGHHLQVFPPTARVVLRCAFPIGSDPLSRFKLYIDWRDFNASLSGRCVPHTLRLPAGVLDCRIEPEVFDCIEDNG